MSLAHVALIRPDLPVVSDYDDRYDSAPYPDVVSLALSGDPTAIYELASRYRLGIDGAEFDCAKAVGLYKEVLVYQNNVRAFYHIGYLLLDGVCGAENMPDGILYLEAAYSLGDSAAAIQLGIQYEYGGVVAQDLNKACDYYLAALNLGDNNAWFYVGEICFRRGDYAEAKGCFERALTSPKLKDDAEKRLLAIDALLPNESSGPNAIVENARNLLAEHRLGEATQVIVNGYREYPSDLGVIYCLLEVYDMSLVAHVAFNSLDSDDEGLCRQALDLINTLRSQSYGDAQYLNGVESDAYLGLAIIHLQRQQWDEASQMLSRTNVVYSPHAAFTSFRLHVQDPGKYAYEIYGDSQLLKEALKSDKWATDSQKALALLALSMIYSSGAPNVPQDIKFAYQCIQECATLAPEVAQEELSKYVVGPFGRVKYRS